MPNENNRNTESNIIVKSDDYIATETSDSIIVTSTELSQKRFEQAMYNLEKEKHIYSAYLSDTTLGNSELTDKELDSLSINPQLDLNKVLRINSLIRKEINKNDLIGKTYEAIESNVNTKIELTFTDYKTNRNKNKAKERAEEAIQDFNQLINLDDLITKIVPMTYSEGNYLMYLRDDTDNYKIDYFPLGVAELSDYEVDGEPFILINVKELTSRLKKANKITKNGKQVFFKNVDEEIKRNYPKEVYEAYINKDTYAVLNIENSGVIRINHLNRKYGVTPMFRALKPSLMLDGYKQADQNNSKARGKTIIFQKTNPEILGEKGDRKPFDEIQYSHMELLKALSKEGICVYSAMPWVSDVSYVEPKNPVTNVNNINSYKNEIATALGINYLISDKTGIAEISIKELLKTIDKITTQIEKILKKFYKKVLLKNNIMPEYTPNITIIDSELLSTEIKLQLCDALFNKYGASFKTVYSMLDRDYETEKTLRKEENKQNLDSDVFYARQTSFTFSAKGQEDYENNGRPTNEKNKDQKEVDKETNKDKGLTS